MALMRAHSGAVVAPAVAEVVHRRTEGNPFFVSQLVQYLCAGGQDLSDPSTASADWGIPAGIRHVLSARLARLNQATNELLHMLAVFGDGCTFETLAAASGMDEALLLDSLDEARRAGVLGEDGDHYLFTHALIRQAVYEDLSLPRRQRLHLAAARAIEQVYARNLTRHFASLGMHYRLAGAAGREQSVYYLRRAGEAAWDALAFEGAMSHWQTALALLEEDGGDTRQRADLLARLGETAIATGQVTEDGPVYFERAIPLYEELRERERAAALHILVGGHYITPVPTMDLQRGVTHLRAAESVLRADPDAYAWQLSKLDTDFAIAAFYTLQRAEGVAASERSLELAERLGDEELIASAAVVYGRLLVDAGRPADGFALMDRAWDLADRHNYVVMCVRATTWPGLCATAIGDPRTAAAWYERELAEPRLAQAVLWSQDLTRLLCAARIASGELAEARRLLPHAVVGDTLELNPAPLLSCWSGDWEGAEAAWTPILERDRKIGTRWGQALMCEHLGWLSRVRGAHDRAMELLGEALDLVATRWLPEELRCRTELALVYVGTRRVDEAHRHLAHCRAILAAGADWRGLAGRVTLAEAVCAAAAGRLPEAETSFAAAIATFRRYTLPWDEAEAHLAWGRALVAAGTKSRAQTRLDAAREIYRRHGAGARWLALVAEQAPGRGRQRPDAGPRDPDHLTGREAEVLRLIAAGRSNREISDDLVLSIRTVERHITNLYAKIGARGRADATAYAVRHGLMSPSPNVPA